MLYLVGLGLDLKDISVGALENVKKCSKIYLESYTNVFPYSITDLEKIIGKKLIIAKRKDVEENPDFIKEAKTKKVALLVSGDPLTATTHVDLLLRAKKAGVKVKIHHAPSILTAIAETGLQLYKFGKTGSIAAWTGNFRPESFYNLIKRNDEMKAHTLLLVDIGLPGHEGLYYIKSIAKIRYDNEMIEDREFIVCEKLGTDDQKITIGKLKPMLKKRFSEPVCIIIPSELHFVEKEFLDLIKKEN